MAMVDPRLDLARHPILSAHWATTGRAELDRAGRTALRRVTPTEGPVTRNPMVLAFNDTPGVRLSTSALETFCRHTS